MSSSGADARGVTAVEALELRLDARLVHHLEQLEDLRVRVGEDHVEANCFLFAEYFA
jgi:hypothetical protein